MRQEKILKACLMSNLVTKWQESVPDIQNISIVQVKDKNVSGYRSAVYVAEKVSVAASFLWYAEKCPWQQELNGLIKKQPATLEKLEQDCNTVL